jgi:hypothetical protein
MVLNFTIMVVADSVPMVGNLGVRICKFSTMMSNFTRMVLSNLVVMVHNLDIVLGNLVNLGDLRLQLTYLVPVRIPSAPPILYSCAERMELGISSSEILNYGSHRSALLTS